jgi:hypothetical protein
MVVKELLSHALSHVARAEPYFHHSRAERAALHS